MRFTLIICVSWVLSACTPLLSGGNARLPETGINGAFSEQVIVAATPHTQLVGQVFVLDHGGTLSLTATLGQVQSSGLGRLRMDSAWQDGRELSFAAPGRREAFCTGGGHCPGSRTGTFVFSSAEFERAAEVGFQAMVVGPEESVAVRYPAHLFVEALARAQRMGLIRP